MDMLVAAFAACGVVIVSIVIATVIFPDAVLILLQRRKKHCPKFVWVYRYECTTCGHHVGCGRFDGWHAPCQRCGGAFAVHRVPYKAFLDGRFQKRDPAEPIEAKE